MVNKFSDKTPTPRTDNEDHWRVDVDETGLTYTDAVRGDFARELECENAELRAALGTGATQVLPTCKGANCGCTDGISHSPECVAEHDAATALQYDEKWLHHVDTGTGWKCYVCNYGGAANNYANRFCANCHCHR